MKFSFFKPILFFLSLHAFSMPSYGQESCPGLEELKALSLKQISNDFSTFNALELWPEELNADEMAYCLIDYGWALSELIYPETLNEEDQNLRLNVIDHLIKKKVSLHRQYSIKVSGFFGKSFSKPEMLKLSLYVGLLSMIDSYWHSRFNSDWSWDEKVQNSFNSIGIMSSVVVGASVVSKRFRSKARKGGANLYKDSRVRRVISNLTKNSRGAVASQGAKAGARETGSEVGSDDESQLTLRIDDELLYYSPAPPFIEWQQVQDAEDSVDDIYKFGQLSEVSLSFDYLTEDIFAQISAFLFGGVGVGILSENILSKSLAAAVAGLNLKIFERSIRAKRFGPKFRKTMRFIRKNGKNHFTFVASHLGAFVISAYGIYAIQDYLNDVINKNRSEEYEDFKKKNISVHSQSSLIGEANFSELSTDDESFVTEKLKEYLRFRKRDVFETTSVSHNNLEKINLHNKIQDLITLFSELVSVKTFKISDVSISLSKKLRATENQNYLCARDTQGTLKPIVHDLVFDDVLDSLFLNKNVEDFDDDFTEVFTSLDDEILWVRDEILEIRKAIKHKSLASEKLLLFQLDRLEKDFDKSLDPEVQLFAAVFYTTSEIITESKSLKTKSFVCGHFPYVGVKSSLGSY